MSNQRLQLTQVTAVLLSLCVQASISKALKQSRPVHEVFEVINERIDDRPPVFTAPGRLPYGNPLAGNSQQNARLHAQNQQAMFNAERRRQQKAQQHRWHHTPPKMDSYMKAYQESQEDHQFAVEQQQVKQREALKSHPVTATPTSARITRPDTRRIVDRTPKTIINTPEIMKITKQDAIINKEKNRNHRSYGSTDYHQYLEPKRYRTVYVSPAPTYDQGVTIKPNGNIGLSDTQEQEQPQLYTEAVPSKTQYVYPKQYQQMQSYQSAQDIEALSSLLKKSPNDQLSEFNAIINSGNEQNNDDELKRPIDLYFYLKDPTAQSLSQHYEQANYAQIPHDVQQAYEQALTGHQTEHPDHKPITELREDTEDPNMHVKGKTYGFQTVATQEPSPDTTTTKNHNYYKVEVASQTISSGYKHPHKTVNLPRYHNTEEQSSSHQTVHYEEEPLALHYKRHKDEDQSDTSERYLQHDNLHHGIQHLTKDGTGVSAYGDDNVSKTDCNNCNKNRKPRSALETDPFYVPEDKKQSNIGIKTNTTEAPKSEKYIGFNPYYTKHEDLNYEDAFDYNDYDDASPYKRSPSADLESFYDDEEEDTGDFSSPDADYTPHKPLYPINPIQNYAPSIAYSQHIQPDLIPSFSNRYKKFKRHPGVSTGYNYPNPNFAIPTTSYGVPYSYPPNPIFDPEPYAPQLPKYPPIPTYNSLINIPRAAEPLYMLTQTQLKNLIGHHNLNIQHLDVYQVAKEKEKRYPRRPYYPHPKKYRKKFPRFRKHKKIFRGW